MMTPFLARPIERPVLFIQDMSQMSPLGQDYCPALGLQYFEDEWLSTLGEDSTPSSDPQDPGPYNTAVSCGQTCHLFVPGARAGCLAACRR